jgi:hypothetical protein
VRSFLDLRVAIHPRLDQGALSLRNRQFLNFALTNRIERNLTSRSED